MYTELIKHNLKSIASIINLLLFLNSIQSNLNFEPSFVDVHQVLREIWLFKHEFQDKFWPTLSFWVKFVNKLFLKLLNFIHISD